MTKDYLQILVESLGKKIQVLDDIEKLNTRQLEISSHQPMDLEAYDQTMDDKGKLIDQLNLLDDGFTATFALVKENVMDHPMEYSDEIKQIQDLVRVAVDKGVAIEAQEKRNKASMETGLRMKRNEIKQMKISNSAALKYYKSMSQINDVDPQLMDRKK